MCTSCKHGAKYSVIMLFVAWEKLILVLYIHLVILVFKQSDWFAISGLWALFTFYQVNNVWQAKWATKTFCQCFFAGNPENTRRCYTRKYKEGYGISPESFQRLEETYHCLPFKLFQDKSLAINLSKPDCHVALGDYCRVHFWIISRNIKCY